IEFLGIKRVEILFLQKDNANLAHLKWPEDVEVSFKYLPVKSSFGKLFGLLSYLKKEKPSLVCVGAQLAYQRIAFFLTSKKIKLLVYNRGLLADISKSPILSLKILHSIPPRLRKYRLLNPFVSDYS